MQNQITKKLFYFLAIFMVSFSTVAQDAEQEVEETAPEVIIDMDFNKSLYTNNLGNMFMSETPKAVLMAMIVPQSYEELKAEINKDTDTKVTAVKKGEATENNVKYVYFTGNVKEDNMEIIVETYVKKHENNSCIIITSMYEMAVKNKYENIAKRAMLTAKIAE